MPDRAPLDEERIRSHVIREGGLWHTVRVLDQTRSTNADAAAFAESNEPEGLVVVAEFQTEGRGRHDRQWVSPPRAGLTFSVLLRPVDVPVESWGWLPLLIATASATALSEATGVSVGLKWPNDLLLGAQARKGGGVLSVAAGDAVVLGAGVNVTTSRQELPIEESTSLELEGAWTVDRDVLLGHLLTALEHDYAAWRAAAGDAAASGLRGRYADLSATLGRDVSVALPGGDDLRGTAVAIDPHGALVVATGDDRVTVRAGDVEHVR